MSYQAGGVEGIGGLCQGKLRQGVLPSPYSLPLPCGVSAVIGPVAPRQKGGDAY